MFEIKKFFTAFVFIVLFKLLFICSTFSLSNEFLKNGVVKIRADEIGTGFIIKHEDDTVFILTASHVIGNNSKPEVIFYNQPINKKFYAEIVILDPDPIIRARELALLKVQGEIPDNITTFKLNEYVEANPGAEVMTIGFPLILGIPWAVTKGEVIGKSGRDLIVSIKVEEGNSGGPLFKNGRVVGIMTECGETGVGYVVPIKIIKITLDGWGFNFKDEYDEESYWELVVSNISYLPQYSEGFFGGNPDYSLSVDTDNGKSFNIVINTGKTSSSIPFMIKGADSFDFKIIESDLFSSDDFTSIIRIEKEELFIKNEYKLFFLNKIINEYKNVIKNKKSLTLSLILQKFNPETNSGTNKSILTPSIVDFKKFYYDNINFNNTDATDYIKILSENNSMTSIVWIISNFNNSFNIVKNNENINMLNIFEGINQNKKREDVYIIENKNDLIIRFHASSAYENADYLIYNFLNKDKISNFVYFIDELIRRESSSSEKITFTNYAVIIKRLRNYLKIPCRNLLPIIKKYFRRGTKNQQKMLINIIEEDLEDYNKANKLNSSPSTNLENLVKLNKAEIGEINNSEDLYPLLNFKNISLITRTINIIGDIGNKESDIKMLNPFLKSDDYNVKKATEKAIESIKLNMSN